MSVIRVGFVLGQVSWLGGVNYFRNLFTAIHSLPDAKIQPVVFAGLKSDVSAFEGLAEIVRSPILDSYTLPWCASKFLSRLLPRRDYLLYWLLRKHRINLISHFGRLWRGCSIPSMGWIPDFQHLHLPQFFDEKEIKDRNAKFINLIRSSDAVLLSSQDALNDLNKFCPDNTTATYVLRFVSCLHPNLDTLPTRSELMARYKLDRTWFHIPNQFWAHKNHGVVVEALHLLKLQGYRPLVIATGKNSDNRNIEYFSSLMKRVSAYGLQDDFRALGVLPYSDVMALMRYSVAIINPSLFEGWSTSVEEAKSMGKKILLSDISVHREQRPPRGFYFSVNDSVELATLLYQSVEEFSQILEESEMSIARQHLNLNQIKFVECYRNILLSNLPKQKNIV